MLLGLGTAQFGMSYGVVNKAGQVQESEVARILEHARASGRIQVLDTAPAYGSSETTLGKLLRPDDAFLLITKIPRIGTPSISSEDIDRSMSAFHDSLATLGRKRVYGVLVHESRDLLAPHGERLWQHLESLRTEGYCEKLGVSVYTPEQASALVERHRIDLIQLPLNVLNQRFIASGQLRALKHSGVEIHVRSIFLQGILLCEPDEIPPSLAALRPDVQAFRRRASELGLTPAEAALAFLKQFSEIDHVIAGVCDLAQLTDLEQAFEAELPVGHELHLLAHSDPSLTDPSQW